MATPPESYVGVGKPARKGLMFNGKTDFISMNHKFMDTIDVTAKFIIGETKNETYKMIWGAGNSANYIAVRHTTLAIFCSVVVGGSQVTFPISNTSLTLDKVHKVRLKYDKTAIKIWVDDVLKNDYPETRSLISYNTSYIGRYTGANTYYHDNAILSIESPDLYSFDLTNPKNFIGSTIKSDNGLIGFITGNPVQLNKESKR